MSFYQNSSDNPPSNKKTKHDANSVTKVGVYQRSPEKLVDNEKARKASKKKDK